MVCPAISGLICPGRPSAVRRFVAQRVVNPLNRMSKGWPVPHVRKKVGESLAVPFPPALTHCNSAATIERKSMIVFIGTALDHGPPGTVFDRVNHAVYSVVSNTHFSIETSTGSRTSCSDTMRADGYFSPAFASTDEPSSPDVLRSWLVAEHGQPTVLLTNVIGWVQMGTHVRPQILVFS